MKLFKNDYPKLHLGLLLMRIGLGIMFVLHGWPKISGGPERWAGVGGAMVNWGIDFAPTFWGFMASISEFGGGILLLTGLFFRPTCVLLFITMLVATTMHLKNGDPFTDYSHALELAIVFFSLCFTGPGRFSLNYNFGRYPNEKSPMRT